MKIYTKELKKIFAQTITFEGFDNTFLCLRLETHISFDNFTIIHTFCYCLPFFIHSIIRSIFYEDLFIILSRKNTFYPFKENIHSRNHHHHKNIVRYSGKIVHFGENLH